MAKSLHEYKVQTMIDRETIKRLTKENEVLKTEMKTLQGQLQNQYVRTKELIDEAKQLPIQ